MSMQVPGPKPAKREPRFNREPAEVRRLHLIEAATRVLSRGGMAAFTIDSIREEANVSRGLINHHFGSLDDLLVEVYQSSLYESVSTHIAQARQRRDDEHAAWSPEAALLALVRSNFEPHYFARENLLVWLSLWSEVAVNPKLRAVHRRLYEAYRGELALEISAVASKRGRAVDGIAIARNLIALIDGLWLEWCLDENVVSPASAEEASIAFLESSLGPLDRPGITPERAVLA